MLILTEVLVGHTGIGSVVEHLHSNDLVFLLIIEKDWPAGGGSALGVAVGSLGTLLGEHFVFRLTVKIKFNYKSNLLASINFLWGFKGF